MILVDTSVWVESRSAKRAEVTAHLQALLGSFRVLGHELIHLELALGQGGDKRARLLQLYERVPQIQAVSTDAVLFMVKGNNFGGFGIGATDACILASAHTEKALIWTLDGKMLAAATQLGCAYGGGPTPLPSAPGGGK